MLSSASPTYDHGVFYPLSKALAFVADPIAWTVALFGFALLAGARRRVALAAGLASAALAVFATFSSPWVADLLERSVEASALTTFRPDAQYDAVIVAAGAEPRVAAGAELVRTGRARFLLYSGRLDQSGVYRLSSHLQALGVAKDRIVIEPRSRNTRENAVESARIVSEHGWRSLLLVTSAAHVERAVGCYRRAGLHPDVLAVDYQPPLRREPHGPGWPSRCALARASEALHEVIGRLVYRAVGYSGPPGS